MKHIVALSGGKDSTAMALRLAEVEPRDYEYICTPTGNEPDAMIAHWLSLGRLLGKPIKPVTTGNSLGGLIRIQNCLPNFRMRWCTRMLKIEPFQAYVVMNTPCTVYVGIRADEVEREGASYPEPSLFPELSIEQDFPLRRWEWGIDRVQRYNCERGVVIPKRTDCEWCFFQTLFEWWTLWKENPNSYAEAEAAEKSTGHTFRSEQRDTHPASLKGLREEFEGGYVPPVRSMADRSVMCSTCAR